MYLRDEIAREHSKKQTETLAGWIGGDKKRFAELMQIFLHDEPVIVQRSAWILTYVAAKNPEVVQPHLAQLIKRTTDKGIHDAVKRNVTGLLQFIDIPETLHGEVMNICFDFLADRKEAIAVRCNAMTVLNNLSKTYPEIKGELKTIMEDILEHEPTAAFRSRAKQVFSSK